MKTISQIFRQQVLAESRQFETVRERVAHVDQTINAMDNTELLDRISDALASAFEPK